MRAKGLGEYRRALLFFSSSPSSFADAVPAADACAVVRMFAVSMLGSASSHATNRQKPIEGMYNTRSASTKPTCDSPAHAGKHTHTHTHTHARAR